MNINLQPEMVIVDSPIPKEPMLLMATNTALRASLVEVDASNLQTVMRINENKCNTTLTLLIVDDSAMVRKMTRRLMEAAGHICHEAVDGIAAIDTMKGFIDSGQVIDAILMDNQMPRMMGSDATKLIREQLGYKGVVIGVTGNVLEEDVRLFVANGANEVIIKPLNKEKFDDAYKRHSKSS
jgi:CheY-like chemotaxis protein